MKGNEYADLIAAYVTKNYATRGIVVYREVSIGKSIIGKNRRVDVLVVKPASNHALAIECKIQQSHGTADEKILYTLQDLIALRMPGVLAYAGEGFSDGVLHMLRGSEVGAYCLPQASTLEPCAATRELDHVLALEFRWWDLLVQGREPFDAIRWAAAGGGGVDD